MELLNGNEKFTLDGNDTGISVSEFWSWAYSDLLNNTLRGVLAEFLVKKSFSFLPPPREILRTDWTPYDLTSPSGRRIEVKSPLTFNLGPRTTFHTLFLTSHQSEHGIRRQVILLSGAAILTCMSFACILPEVASNP